MTATRMVDPNGGPQNPIQTTAPPPNSKPANVLYIKVLYTVQSDGTLSSAYTYHPISGFYPLGTSISSFLNIIRSGGPYIDDQLDPIPGNGVPVVEDPCYVVFSIDPNPIVTFASTASSTDDTTPHEYFNLKTATNSSAPIGPFIAYFRAISPSAKGGGTAGNNNDIYNDHFNLYFDILQSDGSSKAGFLDPAIKNTGH